MQCEQNSWRSLEVLQVALFDILSLKSFQSENRYKATDLLIIISIIVLHKASEMKIHDDPVIFIVVSWTV